MPAKTRLTQLLLQKFLELLAENGGIVVDAADALNVSRTALYARRNEDEEFAAAWDEAVDRGIDVIEDEARRRALVGVDKPVTYQGEITDTYKEKSDFCLGLVLRAHRAKYRNRTEISGPEGGPISNVVVYLPKKDDPPDEREGA
jgi:hypothetical protein